MEPREPGKESGPTQPGQRALSAMALAAQRSRRSGAAAASAAEPLGAWHEQSSPTWADEVEPIDHAAEVDPSTDQIRERPWQRSRDWERAIRSGALVIGAIVVAQSVIVIALNATGGSGSSPPPHAPVASTPRTSARPSATPSRPGSASSTNPAVSTTLGGSGATGPTPEITSISPSSGASGQTVTLSGTNFFSSDGQIQAYFAGAEAPTSCAVQSICTVTVPDLPGGQANVPVKLVTEAGDSNTIFFEYT